MGKDIHVYLIRKHPEENQWKEVILYEKDGEEFKQIPPFVSRDYFLFSYLEKNEDIEVPVSPLFPEFLPDELKKVYNNEKEWCFGFSEMNLADLQIYLLEKPTILDDDGYDSKARVDNPLKIFLEDLKNYIKIKEWYPLPLSCYKVVFWFDC